MNEQLNHIRQLINEGHVDTAISRLNDWLQTASSPTAEAYYLLGNAYRKKVTGRSAQQLPGSDCPGPGKSGNRCPEDGDGYT